MDGISPATLFCGKLYSGSCRRRDFRTDQFFLNRQGVAVRWPLLIPQAGKRKRPPHCGGLIRAIMSVRATPAMKATH